MRRYYVRSCEGFLTEGSSTNPGLSLHVLDALYAHRVVETFRSETYMGGRNGGKRIGPQEARRRAMAFARKANAEDES